eukprot:gb/GECG01007625.1/.p1 GENE.gb/GECG01007625.1/~~gb/GECG01007625.1/.p1  ORF type:complete len:458 (+),score=44.82 gb/GECG01007625.1/:1-1374(+)
MMMRGWSRLAHSAGNKQAPLAGAARGLIEAFSKTGISTPQKRSFSLASHLPYRIPADLVAPSLPQWTCARAFSAVPATSIRGELEKLGQEHRVPESTLYQARYRRPTTTFRGVYWDNGKSGWRAYVIDTSEATASKPFRQRMIGVYPTPEEAARVHDEANIELNGSEALVNFSREDGQGVVKHKKRQVPEYFGVRRDTSDTEKWMVEIKEDGHVYEVLRHFDSPVEAAHAYDEGIRRLGLLGENLRPNFPTRREFEDWLLREEEQRNNPKSRVVSEIANQTSKKKNSSTPFIGVERRGQRFRARLRLRGKVHEIGVFDSMEEAAQARDIAWLELTGANGTTRLNYPVTEYADVLPGLVEKGVIEASKANALLRSPEALPTGRAKRTSRFRGVTWDHVRKRWRARICHRGEIILLGNFKTEFEAVAARDLKALELGWRKERLNLEIETYVQNGLMDSV